LIIPETDVRFDLRGLAKVLIGRTDLAKDVLPEVDLTPHGGELGGVSRRHAIIAPRGEQWFVEDLDSMNGTWLNNRRLTPGAARPLGHGDRLRFGRVVMLFETA
jgi:pSer/pThr/pTyr-binding forkhead associated (FHA) protein